MVYNDDEHGDDAKENGVWMNFLCEKKGETNKKKDISDDRRLIDEKNGVTIFL